MPRVIKRTPDWLVAPTPGKRLFDFKQAKPSTTNTSSYNGPLRTIARGKGSEVFVASGNELRWADLGVLKQDYEEVEERSPRASRTRTTHDSSNTDGHAYRVLKVPGSGPITQLHVSPEREYLAVVRSHQIYVAILPDHRHLHDTELGPYKPKCFHLGPTIHCVEEPAVVSALWHPLGEYGRCLVTIDAEAVVRLWEVNRDDRSTFEQPSTALDLKKLANATSSDQDFSASKFGTARGFTPDSAELEPAAICFGGKGDEGENPWHAMTLWLATKGGDVYALCPLLPKRFQTAPDFVETLSSLVAAKQLEAEEDRTLLLGADAQAQFLASLKEQEPILAPGASDFDAKYVHSRPTQPGPAPKLQGPFDVDPEPDDELEFADIYVTSLEIAEEQGLEGLELPGSASLVCLLTTLDQVLMTLDFDGVDAKWIPTKGTPLSTPKNRSVMLPDDYRTLVLFEVIALSWTNDAVITGPPSFTPDICSQHAIFVTDATGVHYISASSWIKNIQNELSDPDAGGNSGAIRLDVFLESAKSLVEHPINFTKLAPRADEPTAVSCAVFADGHNSHSSLGYFVLTTRAGEPWAAQLDISDSDLSAMADGDLSFEDFESYSNYSTVDQKKLLLAEPRDVYRPDPVFERSSDFPNFITKLASDRTSGRLLQEGVDLQSAPTLDMMITAHRKLAEESKALNGAASVLFAQCHRLQENLREQIKRAREAKERIEQVVGDNDEEDGEGLRGAERFDQRIDGARTRQKTLAERLDQLKSRLGKISTRELSDKEKAWAKEIEDLDRKLVTGEPDEEEGAKASGLMNRFTKVTMLALDLQKQADEIKEKAGGSEKANKRRSLVKVPEGFRKQKVDGILELLEREQVLVDRAMESFEKLRIL